MPDFGSPARSNAARSSGSNYGFSRTSTGQGNWNTGGSPTGTGSFARGISALPRGDTNRVGMPIGPRSAPPVAPPMVQQLMPKPAPSAPMSIPVSHGPKYRPDLNSATLAPWRGVGLDPLAGFRNPAGNYPAQFNGGGPGASFAPQPRKNGYGNDQFGHSLGGFGPTNRGQQRGVGAGYGGGGGGGW